MVSEAIPVGQWIQDNKASFLPPVCNKLMHGDGQLKVMFIGGPNQRKDYHIEEGEELFYQIKGDMVLKIVEQGQHKDVHIHEGEIYVHPSRIPHSPQRWPDTVGLVIERERTKGSETDGLRYYVDGCTDVLWEEWFYCYDLGVQLKPVIDRYMASEEHRTGCPPEGKVFPPPPVNIDVSTTTDAPFSLKQWIEASAAEIREKGQKQLFGAGEFKVTVWGEGEQEAQNEGEVFLWQLEGEAEVTTASGVSLLTPDCSLLLKAGEKYTVKRKANSVGLSVITDPLANK